MRAVAIMLSAVLVAGLALVTGAGGALAAPGEYTIEIGAPASVPVGDAFSYNVTVSTPAANPAAPATGIVVTAQLPTGLFFDSVPFGGDNIVTSAPVYDQVTGVVTFTLRDLTEGLSAFVFTVLQSRTSQMHSDSVLATTVTGTPTDGGAVPSASASTQVTGALNYAPTKTATTIAGSNNRDVTYYFNVKTTDTTPGKTFSSWGQRFTDAFPAGAVIIAQGSTPDGAWTVTGTQATGQTAVWERDGVQYGPALSNLDDQYNRIWVTVRYPSETFPSGTLPPMNSVDLDVRDFAGRWESKEPATVQGPELLGGLDKRVYVVKTAHPDNNAEEQNWGHSQWVAGYAVSASYLNTVDDDKLGSFVLEDSAALNADNAAFFAQSDFARLSIEFSSILAAAAVPYELWYTTSAGPGWKSYGSGLTTATGLRLNTLTAGSVGFTEAGYDKMLDLPLGETLTGWRVVLSPGDDDPTVPEGTEVRVTPSYVPRFSGPTAGPQMFTNTATVSGILADGTPLPDASDTSRLGIIDQVPIITVITAAPTTLTVGTKSAYQVNISNMDTDRTYSDSVMKVVLPVGVFYDPSVGISRTSETTRTSNVPVPDVGDGLTITTETVTDNLGEHQVVVFSFDELAPLRVVGQPKDRDEAQGFNYTLPVTVVAQAYDPNQVSTQIRSFAYTDDPAYAAVPMGWYPTYYGPDIFDFSSALSEIALKIRASTVATSGGLLLGKLVSTDDSPGWATTATVTSPGTAHWQVYASNVLADPVTDVVIFDRLPHAGDTNGSQFDITLAGDVTGAPGSALVEYSTDATTATSGTWTTTSAGATAVRVSIPVLAPGENLTLELTSTAVPEGLTASQVAVNEVSASALYHGAPRTFVSNKATVDAAALPSMTLVKKTNGVVYDSAPGALVASGSDVVWTYEVTNTGNTPLDQITVSDVFTDGQGETGTLTPTTPVLLPLQPGQTRTFTATAPAVDGQYHNTATATAVAVSTDGDVLPSPVTPVTDDSWYFGGSTGLSVVKTTDGEHVVSAPGLSLTPGDQVTWAYTVTNNGSVTLTDLVVTDYDDKGNLVFTDVVPTLLPGESVTLEASGDAVAGQYHNTVTVTTTDPFTGDELAVADDSYYTGALPSFEVSKRVSTSAQGPWAEEMTVPQGTDIFWQITVTNTGNVALVDLAVTDEAIDESFTIEHLAAQTSTTRVFEQTAVSVGYTNSVTVTSPAPSPSPGPGTPLDPEEDTATVHVTPPAEKDRTSGTDSAGGTGESIVDTVLARTGASLGIVGAVLALVTAGGLLLVIRRRQA